MMAEVWHSGPFIRRVYFDLRDSGVSNMTRELLGLLSSYQGSHIDQLRSVQPTFAK